MSQTARVIELPFLAGIDAGGEPVFESLQAELLPDSHDEVRLLKSPLFARNLAAGDKLKVLNEATAEYELLRRSGNLSVRVFRKMGLEPLAEYLSPRIEKLGGSTDLQTDRALVYSIHFSIGFQPIEELLNQACEAFPNTVWYYGNVYDPEDGSTPMNWWMDMEQQK